MEVDVLIERMTLFAELAKKEDVPNGSVLWLSRDITANLRDFKLGHIVEYELIENLEWIAELAWRDSDSSWIGKQMKAELEKYHNVS